MELGGPEALAAVRQPLACQVGYSTGENGVDLEAAEARDVVSFPVTSFVPPGPPLQAGPWSRAPASSSNSSAHGPARGGSRGERSARSLQVEAAFAKAASAALAGGASLRAGGLGVAAEDTSVRRRLPGGAAISARRGSTPIRSATDARSKLERSLRADGACYAVCMAGKIDLEGVSTLVAPRTCQVVNHSVEDSPTSGPSAGPLPSPPADPDLTPSWWRRLLGRRGPAPRRTVPRFKAESGLSGAEFVKEHGAGENLILHLKIFRGKDLFVFSFGCLVCWSFDRRELAAVKEALRPFMVRPIPAADIDEECMDFLIKRRGEGEEDDDEHEEADSEDAATNAIKQDQIILTTSDPLERLAHAYALAQSVKLGSFEIVVGRSIGSTRSIPETMASTGEVRLDARELSKRIGGLLMLRCDVNLHTDILDTPEIFWDEEKFEPHYVACRGYLDIDKRVEILNQRLGVLKDLYDLLQNSLNVKHGNKLEWIVIILILVEVLLELLELLHDAWAG
uniref:DUF155 domain-containing protein n=1 Tax=Alexandrium monilatum TaxID=311494 RepID=A0A7S4VN17_9DINO